MWSFQMQVRWEVGWGEFLLFTKLGRCATAVKCVRNDQFGRNWLLAVGYWLFGHWFYSWRNCDIFGEIFSL